MNNLTKEFIDESWYVINCESRDTPVKFNNEREADFYVLSERVNDEDAQYRLEVGYDDFENTPGVKQFYLDSIDEVNSRIDIEKNHNPGIHIYYTLYIEKSIEVDLI